MVFGFKGCRLESENFSSTIGDNKTVDMTFTVQVGGADDSRNGVSVSGYSASQNTHGGIPPSWTGAGGAVNIPTHPSDGALDATVDAALLAAGITEAQVLGYRD